MNKPIRKEAVEAARSVTKFLEQALRHWPSRPSDWTEIEASLATILDPFFQSAITTACAERDGTIRALTQHRDDEVLVNRRLSDELTKVEDQLAKTKEALEEIRNAERFTHDVFTARLVEDRDGPWVMVDHKKIASLLSNLPAAAETEEPK